LADRFTHDVYLSYSRKDRARVRGLAEELRAAGLEVWFDQWVVKPGDDIYLSMERGLEAARVQVLCMSPAALGSDWVALERSTVLFRDPSNAGRRFVPLLLADCELPDALRRYRYVDYRRKTKAAFEQLVTACRVEGEPVPEPAEPVAVLEREFTGHERWVKGVAVSPDGTWAASCADDKTVKIWDLETGECRGTLKGHTDQVRSVAITPDGKRILSGAADQSVRVWDAVSGRELVELDGHTGAVWSVVALRDNARALSGGFDGTLRLWDIASPRCLKTIKCGKKDDSQVFGTAVNPSGTGAVGPSWWECPAVGSRDGPVPGYNDD